MQRKAHPKSRATRSNGPRKIASKSRPIFCVLLVDAEPERRQVISKTIRGENLQLFEAGSVAEARQQMASQTIDLALIEPDLPDGSGINLAQELGQAKRCTQTIVLSAKPSLEAAIEAIRAGAADFIARPLDLSELNERVKAAIARQQDDLRKHRRHHRLRRICKKLNQARHEVTNQVDTLCNDLVTAYQELASQMQQAVQTSEFSGMVRDELDLESLLRKTLEFLVSKAGATNAVIFLPSSMDEYTVGGYVNYDCTSDSADVLLQHLADVLAPRMIGHTTPVHITDDRAMRELLNDDYAYLSECHLLAFACIHKDETLGVGTVFRNQASPFDSEMVELCAALGPMLGEYLARIIRIHHRHLPDLPFEEGDETCF